MVSWFVFPNMLLLQLTSVGLIESVQTQSFLPSDFKQVQNGCFPLHSADYLTFCIGGGGGKQGLLKLCSIHVPNLLMPIAFFIMFVTAMYPEQQWNL